MACATYMYSFFQKLKTLPQKCHCSLMLTSHLEVAKHSYKQCRGSPSCRLEVGKVGEGWGPGVPSRDLLIF